MIKLNSKLQVIVFMLGAAFLIIPLIFSCKSDSKANIAEESHAMAEKGNNNERGNHMTQESDEADQNISSGVYDGFLLGSYVFDIAVDVMVEDPITDFKGDIITFYSDYTYEIRRSGKVKDRGVFSYHRDKQVLTLRAEKGKSSEWTVNYLDGTMIWVGTTTYGDNSMQIRLREQK